MGEVVPVLCGRIRHEHDILVGQANRRRVSVLLFNQPSVATAGSAAVTATATESRLTPVGPAPAVATTISTAAGASASKPSSAF
jgi:hypothetical protein